MKYVNQRLKGLVATTIVAVGLSACATYGPAGFIYSGGITGMSANNGVNSVKTGQACVTSILSLVTYGDASIAAAKAAGGVTKVASVDYLVNNILGIYGSYCTVVTGE